MFINTLQTRSALTRIDEVTENCPSRITGVRVLASNEYAEMIREKGRKEKEAIQSKQKRRKKEQRRIEKEQNQRNRTI